jgi:hypothetical protein
MISISLMANLDTQLIFPFVGFKTLLKDIPERGARCEDN